MMKSRLKGAAEEPSPRETVGLQQTNRLQCLTFQGTLFKCE